MYNKRTATISKLLAFLIASSFSQMVMADSIFTTTNPNATSAGAPATPSLGDIVFTTAVGDFTRSNTGTWTAPDSSWVETSTPGIFVNTSDARTVDLTGITGQTVSAGTATNSPTPNSATFVNQSVSSSVLGSGALANGIVTSTTQSTNTYNVTAGTLTYSYTDSANTAYTGQNATILSTTTPGTSSGPTGDSSTNVVVSNGAASFTGSYIAQGTGSTGNITGSSSTIAADGTFTFNSITGTYVNNNDGSINASPQATALTTIDGSGITTNALAVTGATTLDTLSAGTTTLGAISTGTLNTTSNATVGGTLAVTGATTLDTLSAGTTTLGATSTTGITNTGAISTGTLNTTSNATVGGTLAVTGASSTSGIANTGNISNTGNLTTGTLNAGATTLNSAVVTNNASIGGNLNVSGNSYLGAMTITANTISANGYVISGVRDGVLLTDAVNLRQLNAVESRLQGQIDDNQKEARSGIAAVAAIAGIPSLDAGKQYNIGIGVGNFKSQSAFALGGNARFTDNVTAKVAVGVSSSETTVSSGLSYNF